MKEELKKEFVLYTTQNPKGSELLKFPDLSNPEKIADWWLSKFYNIINEKIEKIADLKSTSGLVYPEDKCMNRIAWRSNSILDKVITILKD